MEPYTRRINIAVWVDKWNWRTGKLTESFEITDLLQSYRFQKTIKSPKGSCQIELIPQTRSAHMLDSISPMDVVRIFEFGTLKFIGYTRRISYSGSIGRDGRPSRSVVLTVAQYGGLLIDSETGMGLGTAIGKPKAELFNYNVSLMTKIFNATFDGISHKEMVEIIMDALIEYIEKLGGTNFLNYVNDYLSVGPGLSNNPRPLLPRTYQLISGTEQVLSVWQILEQLVERPFNELFIDNGPRSIYLDRKKIELSSDVSYVVLRETPFDGTVGGDSELAFSSMEPVRIEKDYLTRFDFAKSMDEVYTLYSVKHAAYEYNDNVRLLTGRWKVDEERIGKYLFKPLVTQLFYSRLNNIKQKEQEVPEGKYSEIVNNHAETLKNWFSKNDEYLSGAITIMVPSDNKKDPRIGDKISVYGITGSFYVEGIAHTWTYGGALQSNLTVTRGYNRDSNRPIELKDRIFHRETM